MNRSRLALWITSSVATTAVVSVLVAQPAHAPLAGALAGALAATGPVAAAAPPPSPTPPPDPTAAGSAQVDPEIDLGSIIARIHFSFRVRGEGFRGGHDTYGVDVERGVITFKPAHTPRPGATKPGTDTLRPAVIAGTPMRFETVAMGRGTPAPAPLAETRLEDDGSLVLARELADELVANRAEGVEQSWRFAARPRGRGDLIVRVAASGAPLVKASRLGLHFADGKGPGVRYGRATWIDAAGKKTSLEPRFADGMITLRVPADVIEKAAYPAVLDPIIGAEITPAVPAFGFDAFGSQHAPRVADGDFYWYAVWVDQRAFDPDMIVGVRIDDGGSPENSHGAILAANPTRKHKVDLAIDAGSRRIIVAWSENSGTEFDVKGVILDDANAVLTSIFNIGATAGVVESAPSVAFDGSNFLVAFNRNNGAQRDIYAARVRVTGEVLDAPALAVSADGADEGPPSVDFDGTRYLIAWALGGDITGRRWSINGTGVAAAFSIIKDTDIFGSTQAPSVAGGLAPGFLVAAQNQGILGPPNIVWRTVNGANEAKGTLNNQAHPVFNAEFQAPEATAAHEVGEWGIVMQGIDIDAGDFHDLWMLRLDANAGVKAGPVQIISTGGATSGGHDVVFNGFANVYLVVAGENFKGDPDVVGLVVGSDLSFFGTITTLSQSAEGQVRQAVAADGANYLLVWQDWNGQDFDITGVRISSAGAVTGAPVSLASTGDNEQSPDVTFDTTANDYLVVWSQQGAGIQGRRFNLDGTIEPAVGINGFTIQGNANVGSSVSVAYSATANLSLVSYTQNAVMTHSRVGNTAAAVGGAITTCTGAVGEPDVAAVGNQVMVVFSDGSNIRGARVQVSSGGTQDAMCLSLTSTPAPTNEQDPVIASNGTDYMVASRVQTGAATAIRAAPVSTSAVVGAFFTIEDGAATSKLTNPAIAWDGYNYAIAYKKAPITDGNPSDIWGGWFSSTGVTFVATSALVAGATSEGTPALAGTPATGRMLLGYTKFDDGSTVGGPTNALRTRARIISSNQLIGTSCMNNTQCVSGQCIDGVCCQTSCGGGVASDCQVCNRSGLVGTCSPQVAATTCRAAAGVCDTAEACNGVATTCPADTLIVGGTCRASTGVCDVAETCGTNGASCPADSFAGGSTVCRAANGVCDTAETCTGASAACPGDGFATTGVCRAANGVCDVAESCNGSGAACPADAFAGAATTCRAAGGVCDNAENCTGSSAACPADTLKTGSTTCRVSAGTCDPAEVCPGNNVNCPADTLTTMGTQCRAASGVCDVAEACTGASPACPGDGFASAATTCRVANGVCDTAENCTGSAAACPGDSFASSGVCRPAAGGGCDVAESCNGSGAACPADAFASAATTCRAANGVCDNAELCPGNSATCPGDAFKNSATTCRGSAGTCDPAEVCPGNSASCPGDTLASAATVCRAANGDCDAAENCTGAAAACPTDAFLGVATTCRNAAGVCDNAEVCPGNSPSCPTDLFKNSATECRGAAGDCDNAESCTGASAACPSDLFKSSATTCRFATGVCDVGETCTGSAPACPADAFASNAVTCRAALGDCDNAENCTGGNANCPGDTLKSNGTVCRAAAGTCDNVEACNGASALCPGDAYKTFGTECRAAADMCDPSEDCLGNDPACPANVDNDPDVDNVCTGGMPDDNCPGIANPGQQDLDGDLIGDLCDSDRDGDGLSNAYEPTKALNPDDRDSDGDFIDDGTEVGGVDPVSPLNSEPTPPLGLIDALDTDSDNDGKLDSLEAGDDDLGTAPVNTDADALPDYRDPDSDNDGVLDTTDNCRTVMNANQADANSDGIGDACQNDADGDGVANAIDNCPTVSNSGQQNADADSDGDACDGDDDNDGFDDAADNCPLAANPMQEDNDNSGGGDACDANDDADSILDATDNCDLVANEDQANNDADAEGDACDPDDDNDTIDDVGDKCPFDEDPLQDDADFDNVGDVCDNCPDDDNPGHEDADSDGIGDACEMAPMADAGPDDPDAGPDVPDAGPDDPDAGLPGPDAGDGEDDGGDVPDDRTSLYACACRAGGQPVSDRGLPSGAALFALALAGLVFARRRRRP